MTSGLLTVCVQCRGSASTSRYVVFHVCLFWQVDQIHSTIYNVCMIDQDSFDISANQQTHTRNNTAHAIQQLAKQTDKQWFNCLNCHPQWPLPPAPPSFTETRLLSSRAWGHPYHLPSINSSIFKADLLVAVYFRLFDCVTFRGLFTIIWTVFSLYFINLF